MEYIFEPEGVCPMQIKFDINGDVITNIEFFGGCNGNLKVISKLLNGKTVDEIYENLIGNTCGRKATSCGDQLAKAVREAFEKQNVLEKQ